VAVGFGIKTPEQAAAVAEVADAAVVGSAIVQTIVDNLDDDGNARAGLVDAVLSFTRSLADGVRAARREAAEYPDPGAAPRMSWVRHIVRPQN
ncbi:MAG: tryptophan synthase subunit alpha, partial [Alphaproteobacteria bacterium]